MVVFPQYRVGLSSMQQVVEEVVFSQMILVML
jgi:hypothetical protein